jgi:hypothetical protein|uniref:Hydrolase n=1 Tax=Phage DP-2017a TaxID=1955560 RepID=A0A1Q1PVR1_9VIRU|nr:hydrolase [Phage DP-2017a]AQN32086.1 hydrolase [Phage DP-2017a]AQN32102.1 hydrolase [Phage DP-2017a]AQN32118.1 hydrolase [Phage DP-2017a]AQN32134.1 hydrolase [Phage DP-2017a]
MLSILLQTENLNNLTESVNKVTDSSIRIAQAANDFGALRVAFGVFMIFIIIIVILFIWQIFVLSGKLNTIYGAAVKTTEYFETSAEGDIGPSQAQVIVRRNFNSLSQAIKYYILRIRLENHIDDKDKIKVKIDRLVRNEFSELTTYLSNFKCNKKVLSFIVEDDDIQMIEDFIFEQVYIPKNDFTISNMDQSTSIFINGLKLSYIKKIPQ